MKSFIAGLVLVLLPLSAQAFTLTEWRTWQLDTPPFQSQVEQSRWLAKAQTRVHAGGRLLFTPHDSLIWQWQSPAERIIAVDSAGQVVEPGSPTGEPALASLGVGEDGLPDVQQLARLLLHAVQGNHTALNRDYNLLLSGEPEQWRLLLIPNAELRDDEAGYTEIHVEGGRFIHAIHATTPQDNALKIHLLGHQRLVEAEGALTLQARLRSDDETIKRADEEQASY